MIQYLLIFVAGGLGSVARFTLGGWVQKQANSLLSMGPFPMGTLVVNITGCLLIGLLAALLTIRFPVREEYRLMLTVGFLGGFTTFSAFGLETTVLLQRGETALAILYVVLSLGLGLLAVGLGQWLGNFQSM